MFPNLAEASASSQNEATSVLMPRGSQVFGARSVFLEARKQHHKKVALLGHSIRKSFEHACKPARFLADLWPVPHVVASVTPTPNRCLEVGC